VLYYNETRLHSAIGCIAPKDKLEGRAEDFLAEHERKLSSASEVSRQRRWKRKLKARKEEGKLLSAGETDTSSAGAQFARDNRSGSDELRIRGTDRSPSTFANAG
jgi:hypothetical protein